MKVYRLYYLLLLALFLNGPGLRAQNLVTVSETPDVEAYKAKVQDLIDFLEYAMNTIGDPETQARDKNVIITQSYLKAFKDDKVQIEDDLNEEREMVTHKNVQAYLSDIDFFFKEVKFEFIVDDISFKTSAENQSYYLVTMTRNLRGVTIENDSINSNLVRYIEVNLNEAARDLKIASVYTNRLSEEDELTTWWNSLVYPWPDIFRNQLGAEGDLDLQQLQTLVEVEKLDLSSYPQLDDLEPVARLNNLKRIDVSGTKIKDLVALRNLTKLDFLDCSNTVVSSIDPLKYALNLRVLRIDSTQISDGRILEVFENLQQFSASHSYLISLAPITDLRKIKVMDVSKTKIKSLEGIQGLSGLNYLDVSHNSIKDLSPISKLNELRNLKIDNSLVTDLQPLSKLQNLKMLSCNNTLITSLNPIAAISTMERVYCDNTLMVNSEAKKFITNHPDILVVYGTESLRSWWDQLSVPWQKVLIQSAGLKGQRITKEQMARIANITSIDISGIGAIVDIKPVEILKNLKELNIEASGVTDLTPLRGLLELEYLEASNTGISELYSLEQLSKLSLLGIDNTKVQPQEINRFIANHHNCLVMYKTVKLLRWWGSMSMEWRSVLKSQLDHENMSDKERLHAYVNLEKLYFKKPVATLEPIREFTRIRELGFSGTRINNLEPLRNVKTLEVLRCSQSPVSSLEPLSSSSRLKKLNFEDTLVDDLSPLSKLNGLQELKFSGTQVKDLKPLRTLSNLKVLECYNTDVKSLKSIEELQGLRSLKCYNTKVNKKAVQSFRKAVPQCEVVHY